MSRFGSLAEELLEGFKEEIREEVKAELLEGFREEGREEGIAKSIINMKAKGFTPTQIAEILDMTERKVKYYLETYSK